MSDMDIRKLCSAIIKSGTLEPMKRSLVMPIEPFKDMFLSWPGNDQLDLQRLRLKVITLLSLVLMLRSSDLAPRARVFNVDTEKYENVVLYVNNVKFCDDGSLVLTLLGIRNDSARTGFAVSIQPSSVPALCPVLALNVYIKRTDKYRNPLSKPLFLTLKKPYRAINASTVLLVRY